MPPPCPWCDSTETHVVEDVSDEVVAFGCAACATTWASRKDE
jgi:ssDNA-binding Zn-finger/Zn-ribbon topoisomerase 1